MTARLKALAIRRPEEASPRMRPLSRLPVFLALRLIGGLDPPARGFDAEHGQRAT